MKSVILDLDEELTNEQIDLIIKKLEAKKKAVKVETADRINLTVEQKMLIRELENIIEVEYRPEYKGITDVMRNDLDCFEEAIEEDIRMMNETIIGYKDEIDDIEENIELEKQDILEKSREHAQVKKGRALLSKLEKSFKVKK